MKLGRWSGLPLVMVMVVAALVPAIEASAASEPPVDPLEPLRHLYLEAVEDESAIEAGLAAVDSLRIASDGSDGGRLAGILDTYQGALITLKAKHGFWPPDRLRHLRSGLSVMDDAVTKHPHVAEIRYLRLMSCYYLPGILGRGGSVRDDFAALAELLPDARRDYPPPLYRAIVSFVLENSRPTEEQRLALEAALAPLP